MGMSKNTLLALASLGVIVILASFGIILFMIIYSFKEWINYRIRANKRKREIANRFNKPPLAKCHCIDCCYCGGYIQESKSDDRNKIRCLLWKNGRMCFMDDSFCYRAYPRDEK